MSPLDADRIDDRERRDESPETALHSIPEEVFERIEAQDLGHLTSEDAVAALEAERARRLASAASPSPTPS